MEETLECSHKFMELMGNESDESESINEAFICCVCWDLLYKPVILACGHMSCFWCVHKSMSGRQESRCPLCRSQYYHFPYVCQMLHLLLLKLYPESYRRRESQTLEKEKETGCFSPQINGSSCHLHHEPVIRQLDSKPDASDVDQLAGTCTTRAGNTQQIIGQGIGFKNISVRDEDISAASVATAKDRNSTRFKENDTCEKVSVNDLLCSSCKEMLFRPAFLNCGHAFCRSCIVQLKNGIKCEVCESPHPGPIPKVCLELDHFLEDIFPLEYSIRRDNLRIKQEQYLNSTQGSTETTKEGGHFSLLSGGDPLPLWDVDSIVHIGIGCDSCGMYPVIGDRYRCKDCVEKVGFDLCKDCYTTRSKLPGRFNQQHTSDHKFEMMKSNAVHDIMLSLLQGQLYQDIPFARADEVFASAVISSDIEDEYMEDAVLSPLSSSETETNQP